MLEERDFDYVVGKLSRKDKNGNDTTRDRLGKGGRHRDDGTYSAVVYDLEVVGEDPVKAVSPKPQIIVQHEIIEEERQPQCVDDLPLGQQLIYQVAEVAISCVVAGVFYLAGREGFKAAVDYGKRKYTKYKVSKSAAPKKILKVDKVWKNFTIVTLPSTSTIVLDEIDTAYRNYSINMTSEEIQKEFVDAFILRLLSEKKLWEIAHANIADSAGGITDN